MASNDGVLIETSIRPIVDAFIEAYDKRDAEGLKTHVAPWALDVKGGIRGFIDECLFRNNEMSSMGFIVPSPDGTRALAHIAVGKPGQPVRGVRLAFEIAADGRWQIVNAINDGGVEAAWLAGFHDGVSQFKDLPLSAALISVGQRLVQALNEGADIPGLMRAAGVEGQGAAMALAMLKGQARPTQRFTVLPCREHPKASRGAIGLGLLDVQSKFASEFWIICHIDGSSVEFLGTSSYVAMAMLFGHFGKDRPRLREHPMATAPAAMPVSGDAFDRAIQRALEEAVRSSTTTANVEDAFDRAVRGQMATDTAARSRFEALFETLADDRRDELIRRMLKGSGADRGQASQLEALWKSNDFVGLLRTAVATYLAPLSDGGKPVDISPDFLRKHGEALVGTVFGAIFQPLAENLAPGKLLATDRDGPPPT
jgi:hypothetical protein